MEGPCIGQWSIHNIPASMDMWLPVISDKKLGSCFRIVAGGFYAQSQSLEPLKPLSLLEPPISRNMVFDEIAVNESLLAS